MFYNLISVTRIGLWNFVVPLVLVLAGAASLYYVSKRSRLWAFLSAWCAIMLIPVLNVTFWNNVENAHDRYLYLPSVAICAMLALGLARLKRVHFVGATVAALALEPPTRPSRRWNYRSGRTRSCWRSAACLCPLDTLLRCSQRETC